MTYEFEQMIHCLVLDVSMCLRGRIYYGPSCPFKLAREIFIVFFGVHMGNVVLAKINTSEVV
jgi:hypothetical protein